MLVPDSDGMPPGGGPQEMLVPDSDGMPPGADRTEEINEES